MSKLEAIQYKFVSHVLFAAVGTNRRESVRRTSFSLRASYLERRHASFSGVIGNTLTTASVKSLTINKCLQKEAYPSFNFDSSWRSLTISINSSIELELKAIDWSNIERKTKSAIRYATATSDLQHRSTVTFTALLF